MAAPAALFLVSLLGLVGQAGASVPCSEIDDNRHYTLKNLAYKATHASNSSHVAVDFTFLSPFDNDLEIPCHGELDVKDVKQFSVSGTCSYPSSGRLSPVDVHWTYDIDYYYWNDYNPTLFIYQDFFCVSNDKRLVRP
jgi:hypothetical protein